MEFAHSALAPAGCWSAELRLQGPEQAAGLVPLWVLTSQEPQAQACGAVVDAGYVLFAAQTFDDLFGKGRHLSLGDLCHKIYPPFWGTFLPLMRCGRSH